MKLIPLTQGKFAQVDDEDYEHLSKYKWHLMRLGNGNYAARKLWLKDKKKHITISMHREIMKCEMGDKKIIDHKDRNGLNNQKSNLRFCTHSQNMANRQKKINTLSKYMGIHFNKDKRRSSLQWGWVARIKINKKRIYLGCFKTEIEAAKAYNEAAKKNHREFANLNII